MLPEYLDSPCYKNGICRNPDCKHAVKQNPDTGRWFITMGHAGFNSKANNYDGYATEKRAISAMRKYLK